MLLVVLSHSEGVPRFVEYFFRPFFLTSFFFASGYLFHNPTKTFDIKKKIVRIIESILIPYLIYWSISFIVDKSLEGYSIDDIIRRLIYSLLEGKKLWFISCLLCAEIIMSINLYISKNPIYIFLSGIVSFIVWLITDLSQPGVWYWCINIAFLAYLYLAFGYSLKVYEDQISKYLDSKVVLLSLFLTYCISVYIDYQYLNNTYVFALNIFTDIKYYILSSIIGLLFLYCLYNKLKANRIISFISVNSLLIYFFQNQILNLLKAITKLFFFEPLPYWVICLIQSLGTILLVCIPIAITNKYLPIMSGKSKWLSNLLNKE